MLEIGSRGCLLCEATSRPGSAEPVDAERGVGTSPEASRCSFIHCSLSRAQGVPLVFILCWGGGGGNDGDGGISSLRVETRLGPGEGGRRVCVKK